MGLEELLRLDEHAARAARRVVHATVGRLEHLDQRPDDAGRREELATALALGAGELLEEVLVDLTEQVAGLRDSLTPEAGTVEEVDEFAEPSLVDVVPVVDPRHRALEARVRADEQVHRVVDELADVLVRLAVLRRKALGVLGEVRPTSGRGDPEDVVAGVLVDVVELTADLRLVPPVGEQLGLDLLATLVEGVGDVLEEDEPEDDVLVLRRVHRAAQLVGGLPQRVLELLHRRRRCRCWQPSSSWGACQWPSWVSV